MTVINEAEAPEIVQRLILAAKAADHLILNRFTVESVFLPETGPARIRIADPKQDAERLVDLAFGTERDPETQEVTGYGSAHVMGCRVEWRVQ